MVVRQKRKINKKRGFRTPGTGNTKNKRGRGSRMGNPHVKSKGGGSRNFMHIVKYMPERLIRKGFHNPTSKKVKGINVCDLDKLTKNKEIDLSKFGYQKLLGKGSIKNAITVKAQSFTKSAEEKINKAGGKIINLGKVSNDEKAVVKQ